MGSKRGGPRSQGAGRRPSKPATGDQHPPPRCPACKWDLRLSRGCAVEGLVLIRPGEYGDVTLMRGRVSGSACALCSAPNGTPHHLECPLEDCPRCDAPLSACGCVVRYTRDRYGYVRRGPNYDWQMAALESRAGEVAAMKEAAFGPRVDPREVGRLWAEALAIVEEELGG